MSVIVPQDKSNLIMISSFFIAFLGMIPMIILREGRNFIGYKISNNP
ncbi:MAG: hypothetical protein ACK4YF_04065 [Exilispira sp.]